MTRTRAGIILQARFASSRLPGKALERIGSRALLEHCLRRLVASGVARVVLATTTNREDDQLAALAMRVRVPVFRGDADDVLGRYAAAAAAFDLDPIVRATGDNPAVDGRAPGRVLSALHGSGADYVCEEGLPVGAAVEAITRAALRRVAAAAERSYDREHVTPYAKRHTNLFRILTLQAPARLYRPDVRVTVDTRADLEHVRALFARTRCESPTLRQIIEAAGQARSEVA